MSETDRIPCGSCASGTYAPEAILHGVEAFGKCGDRREALKAAPRCKHENHICFGARDFILSMQFPINADAILAEVFA